MKKRWWLGGLFGVALALGAVGTYWYIAGAPAIVLDAFAGTGAGPRIGVSPTMPPIQDVSPALSFRVVASGLEVPWALAFSSDERLFVTERVGRVKVLRHDGQNYGEPTTFCDLSGVVPRGEGGLLGIALDPNFPSSPFVYLMHTHRANGELLNRVVRVPDEGGRCGAPEVLLDGIQAARFHHGGALAFGPDGLLYVGTGDGQEPGHAQDLDSLNGKILRLTPSGEPAPGNFQGALFAYGFRNVTAMAFHPATGELWAASHGPSGEFPGLHARDSVYRVEPGGNHGWPLVVGDAGDPDLVAPIIYYEDSAVPPGGLAFYPLENGVLPFAGNLFLGTLRSEHLQRIELSDSGAPERIERWFHEEYGRIRAVAVGPDGLIYFTTSNRDGRKINVPEGSDYIYRVGP